MRRFPATGEQHVGTFWLLQLNSAPTSEIAPRVAATFQRADEETIPSLAQAMGLDDTSEIQRRFASRCRCYIALVDNILAAYGWVSFDEEEIGELHLRLHLAEGDAYIWDCATLPAHRGLRLYPALLSYIVSELRTEGLKRIWIGADRDNLASQSGMALVGFRPIADAVIACVIASPRLWLRGRPGVPEHLVMDMRRMLFGESAFAWQNAVSTIKRKQG